MPNARAELKNAIIARLDAVCEMHSLGHQASKARRYVFRGSNGATAELMFEQNDSVPANLWVLDSQVVSVVDNQIQSRRSPAAELYKKTGKNGNKLYGRHSALERMQQLGRADLICFNLQSIAQLDRILRALDEA